MYAWSGYEKKMGKKQINMRKKKNIDNEINYI